MFLASSVIAQPNGYNYNEELVPNFELINPLTFLNGDTVETVDDWNNRRAEIYKLFEEHVYGITPKEMPLFSFETLKENTDFMGGSATLKEVQLKFRSDTTVAPIFLIITPNNINHPVPAFVGLNFMGNHSLLNSPYVTLTDSWMEKDRGGLYPNNKVTEESRACKKYRWPVERIIDRGYALITCYYGDFDPDYDDNFENGIFKLFDETRTEKSWGSIGAWSWGYSRIMDYIETDTKINKDKVAIIGHSRIGKTALWAGAQDKRFAMVISNNSGCGGAALSNRKFGETVERITYVFPHWFASNFANYSKKEESLPVDQHLLLSLIAPRPVYVASAQRDQWADPKGEFLSCLYASPVYTFLGTTGLPVTIQPTINRPVYGQIGYHKRSGKHELTNYDWEQYLDFADLHFKEK